MLHVTLRGLQGHLVRLILTAFAVMLGVSHLTRRSRPASSAALLLMHRADYLTVLAALRDQTRSLAGT